MSDFPEGLSDQWVRNVEDRLRAVERGLSRREPITEPRVFPRDLPADTRGDSAADSYMIPNPNTADGNPPIQVSRDSSSLFPIVMTRGDWSRRISNQQERLDAEREGWKALPMSPIPSQEGGASRDALYRDGWRTV